MPPEITGINGLMSDSAQTNLTDRMIARLEEANTRSYKEMKRTKDGVPGVELGTAHGFEDRKIELKQETSRLRSRFALLTLAVAASAGLGVLVLESSYGHPARQFINKMIDASGSVVQGASQQALPGGVGDAQSVSPELEQRLQRITDELADTRRSIEQLKISQGQNSRDDAQVVEQLRASREQLVSDYAKVANQLNAAIAQSALHETTIAAQLKTTQQQLAEIASSRPASPPVSPELEQRLQRITDELADTRRSIEQLKISQEQNSRDDAQAAEQLRATREQLVSDYAKVANQLNAAIAESALHETTIAAQLKTTQQQLAEIASSRPASPARKSLRRRRFLSPSATERR